MEQENPVTISDVAKLANVSTATVSRVLNNPSIVSPRTIKKVEKTIEYLNYHPNNLGKKLRQSKSNMIMVMVTDLSSPYYSVVIDGIQKTAQEHNYDIMICQNLVKPELSQIYLAHLMEKTVDGLIILDNTIDNSLLGTLDFNTYPVVQCSQYCENENIPFVSINDKLAMKNLVKHLVLTGRKKIALLNGDRRFIYPKSRLEGYQEALSEFGIPYNEDLVIYIDQLNIKQSLIGATKLFESNSDFDAIIGVADIFAVAALRVALIKGYQIPKDIAIASFDNTAFSILSYPSITSISQPRFELGVKSLEMLIQQINKIPLKKRQVFLDTELVVRGSTIQSHSHKFK